MAEYRGFAIEDRKCGYRNYSFKGDVILDPFAGAGTVGKAAAGLGRRFALMEANLEKFTVLEGEAQSWLRAGSDDVLVWSKPMDFLHQF